MLQLSTVKTIKQTYSNHLLVIIASLSLCTCMSVIMTFFTEREQKISDKSAQIFVTFYHHISFEENIFTVPTCSIFI